MNTVTLIDGRKVSSDSEEWRAECEARAVCRMPGYYHEDRETRRRTWIKAKGARNQYLMRVQDKRGKEAADQLRELVLHVWNAEFRVDG